jgi:hypothetical protein
MDDIPRKLPQLFYFSAANLNNKYFIENISTVVVINATKIRLKSGKNAATIRKQNATKIRLKFGKNATTIRKQNATKIRLTFLRKMQSNTRALLCNFVPGDVTSGNLRR